MPDETSEEIGVAPDEGALADVRAAVDRRARPAVVVDPAGGELRFANAAARRVLAGSTLPALEVLVPDPEARGRLRERAAACLPWRGKGAGGAPLAALPVATGDRVQAVCIYVSDEADEITELIARRAALATRELARRRRHDARRDVLYQLAMGVGRGLPVSHLAGVAVEHLARLLPVSHVRVALIEGDSLHVLAAIGGGAAVPHDARPLLSTTPAELLRASRSMLQLSVAEHADRWPALHAARAEGARCALFVPLTLEEATFGFIELVTAEMDAFPDEDAALAAEMAGMLATALLRERVMEQAERHARAMELQAAEERAALDRTQEQLVQAAKLSSIGELAAGLFHELNQPLNVLGGYVELLGEGTLSEAARSRALDVMMRAVERMTSMIDNLRNFSRSGAPSLARVDVAEVVRMARELTVGALKRGVTVECPADLLVLGDANRLEQVFINLVANALQCEGDPVTVACWAEDDRVVIEVRDRGPGVPVALRQQVFEPFFTTKPPGQGTGLGLSVSTRIVHAHGGRIEIDDNPGGGAIFRVVLPAHRPRGAEMPS